MQVTDLKYNLPLNLYNPIMMMYFFPLGVPYIMANFRIDMSETIYEMTGSLTSDNEFTTVANTVFYIDFQVIRLQIADFHRRKSKKLEK